MSAFLCSPQHIGQVVAWGNAHGPDPVAGAQALAFANLRSLAARHRLDMVPDWESRVAGKFGGTRTLKEYLRLCVVESRQPWRLTAASIANVVEHVCGQGYDGLQQVALQNCSGRDSQVCGSLGSGTVCCTTTRRRAKLSSSRLRRTMSY